MDTDLSELVNKAYTLFQEGQHESSKQLCLEILNKSHQVLHAIFLLGKIAWEQRDIDRAEKLFQACIEIEPRATGAIRSLGLLYIEKHQVLDAINLFNKILSIKDDFESLLNLAVAHLLLGLQQEAFNYSKRAILNAPGNKLIHDQLMLISLYSPGLTPQQIYEEHCAWASLYGESVQKYTSWLCEDSGDHRIRIAYLCHDTFKQSVSFFFEPVIRSHDRQRFEIVVYATYPEEDAYAQRLKTYVDLWRNVSSLEEREIAEIVYQDKINIFVDVTGHTAPGPNNKLLTFAYKPAPIQISWLAYPATTGLRTIDYRITDKWADPIGMTEAYHTEKLIRIPQGFLCYQPEVDSPEIVDAPCQSSPHIVFGCFTFQGKITPEVIKVWSSILQRVKNSKLCLKYKHFQHPDVRSAYLERFLDHGIEASRVQFLDFQPLYRDHLDCYRYLDIALDPFPYNGTTSTHEALWMGVPVITLAGNYHHSRVGVSILSRIGLPDLIADSTEGYIQIAISLSEDRGRIQELRRTLRPKMLNSPLTQAKEFTAQLELEYSRLWQAFLKTEA